MALFSRDASRTPAKTNTGRSGIGLPRITRPPYAYYKGSVETTKKFRLWNLMLAVFFTAVVFTLIFAIRVTTRGRAPPPLLSPEVESQNQVPYEPVHTSFVTVQPIPPLPKMQFGFVSVIIPLRTAFVPLYSITLLELEAKATKRPLEILIVLDPALLTPAGVGNVSAALELATHPWRKLHQLDLKASTTASPTPSAGVEGEDIPQPLLYATLGQLLEAGANAASEKASHLLFLSPTHIINSTSFLQLMFAPMLNNSNVAATQATVLGIAPKNEDNSSTVNPDFQVIDQGFDLVMGVEHSLTTPLIARRLTGFGWKDRRLDIPQEVDFVTPYAMLVDRLSFLQAGRFTSTTDTSVLDRVLSSQLDPFALVKALTRLKYRINRVEKTMEAITIAEVHRAGSSLRQQVRMSYSEVVEGSTLWEDVAKKSIDSGGDSELMAKLDVEEKALTRDVEGQSVEIRLRLYSNLLVESIRTVKALGKMSDAANTEESIGWELSLKWKQMQKRVFVTPARVLFDTSLYPKAYIDYVQANQAHPYYPSYSIHGPWEKRWGKFMIGMHRSQHLSSRTRVIWDAYCCGCCGFSTEIAHFVAPLQHLYQIHLLLGPQCFCKGAPASVFDSLRRLHMETNHFVHLRTDPDESIVWIAHTDPFGWRNAIWDKRKPDYLIGRSMYEFSRVGQNWVEASAMADEIWVPAEFVRNMFAISGIPNEKLVVIPEALDTNFYDPASAGTLALPLKGAQAKWKHFCNRPDGSASAYKFFSNFKWEPRKGWNFLFEGYWKAFRNEPAGSVSLYVLSYVFLPTGEGDMHNLTFIEEQLRTLEPEIGVPFERWPHFCIITEVISETELVSLYNSVDAFVLPTRGEGWGLPSIQAMSMGLPVISTNWGGNLGFMTSENSFLIQLDGCEEVPSNSIYGWQPGKKWATPSVSHTAQLMHLVFTDRHYAKKVGAFARKDISERFSEEAVADVVDRRLQIVAKKVAQKKQSKP